MSLLDPKQREAIQADIAALTLFPNSGGDVRKLQGASDSYRLRRGRFRVLFVLDKGNRQIVIASVSDRKDAYG